MKLKSITGGKLRNSHMHRIKQHTPKQWVKGKVKREIENIYIETNENGNTTYQNLRDSAKAVLR